MKRHWLMRVRDASAIVLALAVVAWAIIEFQLDVYIQETRGGDSNSAHLPLRHSIAYDGDTLRVTLEPANEDVPDSYGDRLLRLVGVDTPELRGECEEEKALARAARDRVRQIYAGQDTIEVTSFEGADKYGRIVARVRTPDGRDLSDVLIEEGLGRPYDGGKRASWCDPEVPNDLPPLKPLGSDR